MKIYLIFTLSLLFFSACIKDNNGTLEITMDYRIFGHVISWTEVESKAGESNWENISDGQKLTFYFKSVDKKLGLPNYGVVQYQSNLNMNIKNNTSYE